MTRILLSRQIGEAGVWWWSTAPLQMCGGGTFLRRLINKQQSFMRLHSTSCVWLVFCFFLPICTKSQSGNRTGESPESSFRCLQSWSNTSLNLCTAPMPEIWNWKREGGNDNMETQKQVLNVEGKIWNQTLKWCHFCQDATLMRHLMRSPPKKLWPFRLWPSPKDRQVFWTAAVKPTTVQSEYSRMRGNLFCGL